MKIVINNCFGGFNLSPKAVKRLAELQDKECYFFNKSFGGGTKYTPTDNPKSILWTAFMIPNPNEVLNNDSNWATLSLEQRTEQNKKYNEVKLDSSPENRADPLLVKVVEELGKEANGSCAELKIVEIPDDVKWEISEYDGNEHIAEKHRTWS